MPGAQQDTREESHSPRALMIAQCKKDGWHVARNHRCPHVRRENLRTGGTAVSPEKAPAVGQLVINRDYAQKWRQGLMSVIAC
jgi:hypothetical protein